MQRETTDSFNLAIPVLARMKCVLKRSPRIASARVVGVRHVATIRCGR